VIVSLNGEAINDACSLALRISPITPGVAVRLGVVRYCREDTLTLRLCELPRERQASRD
jgi:S1-C subfamily serine protease